MTAPHLWRGCWSHANTAVSILAVLRDARRAWLVLIVLSCARAAPAPVAHEVIVDNVDLQHVEVGGAWRSVGDAVADAARGAPYGFEYLEDQNSGKGAKHVTFRPDLKLAGQYKVFLWHTSGPDRAQVVPVEIQHDEGVSRVEVDQTRDGGRWNLLGDYSFTGKWPAGVTIRTGGTAGHVIADAVKFQLQHASGVALPRRLAAEPLLALTAEPMLLIDDFALSEKQHVRRVFARASKAANGEPILKADRPWEVPASFGSLATVLHDDRENVFKMWYWPQRFRYAYATSKDGFTWSKTDLGLAEWKGSRANNLLPDAFGKHLIVYRDEQEPDSAHRYKGVTDSRRVSQARLMHSPDGLHWHFYHGGEPVTYRAADFTNHVLWDPAKQAHLLITRTDYGTTGGTQEIRGVRVMMNANLKQNPDGWRTLNQWRLERPGDLPGRRQIYLFVDQIHAGVHIALAAVYEHIGDLSEGSAADTSTRHERDILNAYLVTSRDGVEWNTDAIYDGGPLIERGGHGAFDKDVIMPISFVTLGDEHLVYYNGWNERHNRANQPGVARAIGVARLPRDRFSGLAADSGTLTTKAFRADAAELEVNCHAAHGKLHAEVLDESRRPIPGYALSDSIAIEQADGRQLPLAWQGKRFADLDGRTVRLRFHLTHASLFAFGYRVAPR